MSAGLKIWKYLVLLQNVVLFFVGSMLVGFGAYLATGGNIPGLTLGTQAFMVGTFIVAAITLIVSGFGCCGATSQNRIVLGLYFSFLMVLTILAIASAVVGFSFYWQIDESLEMAWNRTSLETRVRIYEQFNCCGFKEPDNSPVCEEMKKKNPLIEGCQEKLKEFALNNLTSFLIVALVVAIFFIVGMTLASCLFCKITNKEDDRHEESRLAGTSGYAPVL